MITPPGMIRLVTKEGRLFLVNIDEEKIENTKEDWMNDEVDK